VTSDEDAAPEGTEEYLAEWLRRYQREAEIAPTVKTLHEFSQLKMRAFTAIKARAPAEITQSLQHDFDRELAGLRNTLPLPPLYRAPPITIATSTATTSAANVSVTQALLTMRLDPDPAVKRDVDSILAAFEHLHERHHRVAQARELLARQFPALVTFFDRAERSARMATAVEESAPAAANEARILMDKLKGELFDRARKHHGDKMTWSTMAFCLGADRDTVELLAEAEVQRSQIYGDLSDVAKQRTSHEAGSFMSIWLMVVDHVLVVCGYISTE